jgi:hypothetical protein
MPELSKARDHVATAYNYLAKVDNHPIRVDVEDALGPVRERLHGVLVDLGNLVKMQGQG